MYSPDGLKDFAAPKTAADLRDLVAAKAAAGLPEIHGEFHCELNGRSQTPSSPRSARRQKPKVPRELNKEPTLHHLLVDLNQFFFRRSSRIHFMTFVCEAVFRQLRHKLQILVLVDSELYDRRHFQCLAKLSDKFNRFLSRLIHRQSGDVFSHCLRDLRILLGTCGKGVLHPFSYEHGIGQAVGHMEVSAQGLAMPCTMQVDALLKLIPAKS